MRILVSGANGFIGSYLSGALLEAGHEVIAAVRRPEEFLIRFPAARAIHVDLNRDVTPEVWVARLHDVDAVVNCAGILRSRLRQSARAIHVQAPLALFEACRRCGIRRIVHVSAVSADFRADTDYARTKAEAEEKLSVMDMDWIILRPSLVYAEGTYGGTSLLRGLAALPGFLPVAGGGDQLFRPIHARDLAISIVRILERPEISRVTLEPGGPETIALSALLGKLRAWLGLRPAREIRIPMRLCRIAARIGDFCGAATFNTTALRQLEFGNIGSPDEFVQLSGVTPASMDQWMLRQPSHVQDRWHARLYWVRLLLRYCLAGLWIASGVIGLVPAREEVLSLLAFAGLSVVAAYALIIGTCALDIAIGMAVAVRWRPKLIGVIQLLLVAGYTIALSVNAPSLWSDPLGALLKNLPILAAIVVWMILENDH